MCKNTEDQVLEVELLLECLRSQPWDTWLCLGTVLAETRGDTVILALVRRGQGYS